MNLYEVEQQFLKANTKLEQIIEFIKNKSELFEAHQVEEYILQELLSVGKSLLSGYFTGVSQNNVGISVINSENKELKRHENKTREYFSVFGKIKVKRQIYWKKGEKRVVPLDYHCNLPEQSYSYFLQDIINDISVDNTFAQTQKKLKKLFNINIGERQIEELPSTTDAYCTSYLEQKEPPKSEIEGELQIMEFDGKGVPIIKKDAANIKSRQGKGEKRQKKKEALIGVSYTVDKRIRSAEEIVKHLIYPEQCSEKNEKEKSIKAQNVLRFGSLKMPKTDVVKLIENDAIKRNIDDKKEIVILLDGSLYQEKIVRASLTRIEKYTVVLDIIHVIEYLYEAAHALYSEKGKEVKKYVYELLLRILQGKVGGVIGGLKQTLKKRDLSENKVKTIEKVIRYLSNHKDNMQYNQYIKKGYPIATGVVESTCKQLVIGRMEGAGMKWSLDRAESMLFMRSISKSEQWEEFKYPLKKQW